MPFFKALHPSQLRWLFSLFLCALPSLPSTASLIEGAGPRFFIESIQVEGLRRVTPEIILSEALLVEGTEYSEAELSDAVHRLVRLPFLLEARFALERGSERGKLRLLITVEEVRRYFFGVDWRYSNFGRNLTLEGNAGALGDNFQLFTLAGMRFFPGRESVAFVSVANGGAQAGYTRYGLGKRGASLSLGYQRQLCCITFVQPFGVDPSFTSWSSGRASDRAAVTLGVPLDRQRALRFEFSYEHSEEGTRRPIFERAGTQTFFPYDARRDARFEAAWHYDTTDDPTFPTRGDTLTIALELRDFEADFSEPGVILGPFPTQPLLLPPIVTTMRSQMVRAVSTGNRHWPRGRHTISAGFRVAIGHTRLENLPTGEGFLAETDLDVWEASLNLRHVMLLYRSQWQAHHRELFWETQVGFGIEGTSPDLALLENPLDRVTFHTNLAWRTGWGILRLGFTYLDFGRAV